MTFSSFENGIDIPDENGCDAILDSENAVLQLFLPHFAAHDSVTRLVKTAFSARCVIDSAPLLASKFSFFSNISSMKNTAPRVSRGFPLQTADFTCNTSATLSPESIGAQTCCSADFQSDTAGSNQRGNSPLCENLVWLGHFLSSFDPCLCAVRCVTPKALASASPFRKFEALNPVTNWEADLKFAGVPW